MSELPGKGVRLLLVDNDDCFIQTLANYVRQTGAEVMTYRAGFPLSLMDELRPDILLISPGPGRRADFGVPDLVRYAAARALPTFGVCLGLQGMVEGFGGELGVLPYPVHGKPSLVSHQNAGVFEGLPRNPLKVGGYHSLYAITAKLPPESRSRRSARTASSWASDIGRCRWRRCSFIPSRCSRRAATMG